MPDGVTPVHVARNQALSNVCVPTTTISLAQSHDSLVLGGGLSISMLFFTAVSCTVVILHTMFLAFYHPFYPLFLYYPILLHTTFLALFHRQG